MLRIRARHIQLSSPDVANQVMQLWQAGENFADLAKRYSECSTAVQGGSLGHFGPGQMSPEIDAVCMRGEPGGVYGPIQTAHGIHLVEVIERAEV
ncbi:Foldase protein PrsA precursor [Stieleria bergensis]|uniref:Foldase protein PrsA n=1 Tax=Stieleria bergensis TaxID=2528025 RepID=A0A517SY98_9BACT|nr:MAG: hypothetical protein CBB71_07215 [Rhodopirellula sp. TMED11]QDT61116.1 Foldase protein PrsA precursor [Planctomycetes bacterium SV_7m_r]